MDSGVPTVAPRSATAIAVSRWAGVTAWMLLAFLAVLLASGTQTWSRSSHIEVPWLLLAVGFFGIAAHTALGLILGRFLPLVALIPVAVLVGWLGNAILGYEPGTPTALFSLIDNGVIPVGFRLRPEVGFAQSAWYALLAAALLCATAFALRPALARVPKGSWVVFPALVAVVVVLTTIDGERAEAVVASGPRECSNAGPTVCVWRDHAFYLDSVSQVAHREFADLTPSPANGLPAGFVETGLIRTPDQAQFAILSNNASLDQLSQSLALATLTYSACQGQPGTLGPGDGQRDLLEWLAVRALPEDSDVPIGGEVARIRGLPMTEQTEWFRTGLNDQTCLYSGDTQR